MYLYNIGYNTCEYCPEIILQHENKYTKEELQKICIEALVKVWKQQEENEKLSEDNIELESSISYWFETYYSNIIDELVNNYEFKHIEITEKFIPFGWGNITIRNSWEEYCKNNKDNIAIWDAFEKFKI